MTLSTEASNVAIGNKLPFSVLFICVYTKLIILILTCMKSNLLMFES